MGTEGVDLGAEGPGRSHQGLDRQGGGQVGSGGQSIGPFDGEAEHGAHAFGPVEKTQALLGLQAQRLESGRGEGIGGRSDDPVEAKPALSDDGEEEMGKGSEVTRRSHRPVGGHDGEEIPGEQVEEALHDQGPHPGVPLSEGPGPQEEHGADDVVAEGVADAGGVAAEKIHLEGARLGRVDPGRGEGSEPGGDAVDDLAALHRPRHHVAGRSHAVGQPGIGNDGGPALSHRHYVFDAQWSAVEEHIHGGHSGTGGDARPGTVAVMIWAVTYERKVRYSDTDAQGIVFNGNYATYFDDTMTDFFDLVGYRWDEVEVVLGRLEIDFRSPGRLGETLVTGARVERIGTTSFTVHLATWEKQSERLVAEAKQIQVVVDSGDFRPVPVPAALVAAIEAAQST